MTVGSRVNARDAVALKFIRCVRNKLTESSNVVSDVIDGDRLYGDRK